MNTSESETNNDAKVQSKLAPAEAREQPKQPKTLQPKNKAEMKKSAAVPPAAGEDKALLKNLPEILKGAAAVITAIGGIITVLLTAGIIGQKPDSTPLSDTLIVVETKPKDGALDVNASLDEIVITFNQPVNQERWSFVAADQGEFPEMTGDPYFKDGKTCVIPVKLEPGKTYGVGVNSPTHQNFVAAADEMIIAEPYQFGFTTKP